jgi:hypothetical protein
LSSRGSTSGRRSRSCIRPTWCARRTGCSSKPPRRWRRSSPRFEWMTPISMQ